MERVISYSDVMKKLIITYKSYPCLWKNEIKHNTPKVEKDKAYAHLLSIYKQADPFANFFLLKRKLGSMRSTYKREYKKVLETKSKGIHYEPTLWYYPYFVSFLDSPNDTIDFGLESDEEITFTQASDDDDSNELYLKEVHIENESQNSPAYTHLEILESDEDVKLITEQKTPGTSTSQYQTRSNIAVNSETIQGPQRSEVEYFGRIIGLQLQELNKLQKSIAEKLISEVIFYGRLNKLNNVSVISLD